MISLCIPLFAMRLGLCCMCKRNYWSILSSTLLDFLKDNQLRLTPTPIMGQAAEALGAIGLQSNVPILERSLVHDPAQEVRETCELALSRIKQVKSAISDDSSSVIERSPFMSVDPAAPASCSSVCHLRLISYHHSSGVSIF